MAQFLARPRPVVVPPGRTTLSSSCGAPSALEFTLYAADGSVFAKKASGSNGLVVFSDLPIGG